MSDDQKRHERAAKIRREIQKRRAARATGFHGRKTAEDSFEQPKVKMVMRIHGVSCERVKEIIAGRAVKTTVGESENRKKAEMRIGRSHCCDCGDDGEWLPVGEIIVGDEA